MRHGVLNIDLRSGTQPPPSKYTPSAINPVTIRKCESNQCLRPGTEYSIIWNFSDLPGVGWPGPQVRPMTIEHYSSRTILVRREDGDALGGRSALYFWLNQRRPDHRRRSLLIWAYRQAGTRLTAE